jgi:hypothetical protein
VLKLLGTGRILAGGRQEFRKVISKSKARIFRYLGGVRIDRSFEVQNIFPRLLIACGNLLRGLDLTLHFPLHS